MNKEIFDIVETKLTELRLKERYNRNDKKYILTKEELIKFCLDLVKVIRKNDDYDGDYDVCDICGKAYPSTYITRFPNETICHQCIDNGYGA